jgi:FMN reductase
MTSTDQPLIVGIGGTLRIGSSTEQVLRLALSAVERQGGRTLLLDGHAIDLPHYVYGAAGKHERARALIEAVRKADGVILASPGYHGTLSGHMKNAIDYIEELRGDARPYLSDRAVGCIATAAGWQGAVNTLVALRSVVHALRGWPTPLGASINTAEPLFDGEGRCLSSKVSETVQQLAGQVMQFAALLRATRREEATSDVA